MGKLAVVTLILMSSGCTASISVLDWGNRAPKPPVVVVSPSPTPEVKK